MWSITVQAEAEEIMGAEGFKHTALATDVLHDHHHGRGSIWGVRHCSLRHHHLHSHPYHWHSHSAGACLLTVSVQYGSVSVRHRSLRHRHLHSHPYHWHRHSAGACLFTVSLQYGSVSVRHRSLCLHHLHSHPYHWHRHSAGACLFTVNLHAFIIIKFRAFTIGIFWACVNLRNSPLINKGPAKCGCPIVICLSVCAFCSTYCATFTKLAPSVHLDMIYWCHTVVCVLDLYFTLEWLWLGRNG